ncbi:MAG TPA: DNA-3-methyladenine glycosylase [Flavobacteriaceae bacterium]|nr:DNA-3-methyladenine glycosylase [Flavobacteriaceae bacterium]
MSRLKKEYFRANNALVLAEDLLGKILVRDFGDGDSLRLKIIETEAYLGMEDRGNHASKGRTPRTEIMFTEGGVVYAYLIYGMHWLLNIVTGPADNPEAVLIRGVEGVIGPGRVGKLIGLDRSFYGEDLETSERLWIEDGEKEGKIVTSPRIGIDYAGEIWKNKPWRFELK